MAMIGAVAEFERSLILERQREGIEQAKKINVYNSIFKYSKFKTPIGF